MGIDAEIERLEDLEPWKQLPDEPDAWYERFKLYLSLGKLRNPNQVYEACRENEGDACPAVTTFYSRAKKHDWERRAEAHDIYQYKKRKIDDQEDRLNVRAQRRAALQMALDRQMRRFEQEDGNLEQKVYALTKLTQELRKEYGDDVVKHQRVSEEEFDASEMLKPSFEDSRGDD